VRTYLCTDLIVVADSSQPLSSTATIDSAYDSSSRVDPSRSQSVPVFRRRERPVASDSFRGSSRQGLTELSAGARFNAMTKKSDYILGIVSLMERPPHKCCNISLVA